MNSSSRLLQSFWISCKSLWNKVEIGRDYLAGSFHSEVDSLGEFEMDCIICHQRKIMLCPVRSLTNFNTVVVTQIDINFSMQCQIIIK
jgi:hypothetical protein